MNRIVYVPSYFAPVVEDTTVEIPTGEKTRDIFRREQDVTRTERRRVQTGWSDCEVDGTRLADDVAEAVAELNNEGYEVVSITPITSGYYDYNYKMPTFGEPHRGYGYGYGYSYTTGVIITAKEITS